MVAQANLKQSDSVLEIGSGTGFLTEKLLEKSNVIGIESDAQMQQILKDKIKHKNFTLLESDYLKTEIPESNKIVSLPPYSISDDIVMKIIQNPPELAVLVFQREFVEKLSAFPGYKEYSYLSVLTNIIFDVNVPIENISPLAFFPKPESYSSLIVLARKKKPELPGNLYGFIFFMKSLFRFKNKTVLNAINNCSGELEKKLGITYEKTKGKSDLQGIFSQKVNLLEPEDFVELFRQISPK